MDFITAMEIVSKHPNLSFCEHPEERNGQLSFICVYNQGNFVGKIRFSEQGYYKPSVDDELLDLLSSLSYIL